MAVASLLMTYNASQVLRLIYKNENEVTLQSDLHANNKCGWSYNYTDEHFGAIAFSSTETELSITECNPS